MIQRIQSIYLALVLFLDASFVFTPLFSKVMDDPSAWLSSTHVAAIAFSAIVSVYAIFLFSNRDKQIKMVKAAIVFQVIGFGSALGVLLSLGGIGSYLWDEALSWLLLLSAILFQLLALNAIRKDINLVKSMDRIR